MTIRAIKIENVKGIEQRSIEAEFRANKPNILIAPNGFGKSSLAAAFSSLMRSRLQLQEQDYHKKKEGLEPKLELSFDVDGLTRNLVADSGRNQIAEHFDVGVISSQLRAKASAPQVGGRVFAKASLEIETVELVSSIPEKHEFEYNYTIQKQAFGENGKVLPNLSSLFGMENFCINVLNNRQTIDRCNQVRNSQSIQNCIDAINAKSGTRAELLDIIKAEVLADLEAIGPLNELRDTLGQIDRFPQDNVEAYLATLEVIKVYAGQTASHQKLKKYYDYYALRQSAKMLLDSVNSSWQEVRPSQKGTKLIIEFPKANLVSNGQRDIMSFVAQLLKFQRTAKKECQILIIDEIFDYLDDANLIICQFFITNFISQLKEQGHKIYPIILTHLDPAHLRTFAFSKQNTIFLSDATPDIDPNMRRLLLKRNEAAIKDGVSRHLFHYHPDEIALRAEFEALKLKPTWGQGTNFQKFALDAFEKYLRGTEAYDPFAVCCELRRRIEQMAYGQISEPENKATFLETTGTRNKIEYAASIGVKVPEVHFILGLVYNDALHCSEQNIAQKSDRLVHQLGNSGIRQMIKFNLPS